MEGTVELMIIVCITVRYTCAWRCVHCLCSAVSVFICYCSWKALYCLKGKKWKRNELKCSCRFSMIEKLCKNQKYEICDCNIQYIPVHHVHVCVFVFRSISFLNSKLGCQIFLQRNSTLQGYKAKQTRLSQETKRYSVHQMCLV